VATITPTTNTSGSSSNTAGNEYSDYGGTSDLPQDQASTVTSNDGLLTLNLPAGTFTTTAVCQINTLNRTDVPVKSAKLLGPYLLSCDDTSGHALTTLHKSITVTIKPPASASSYTTYVKGSSWQKVKTSLSSGALSFQLTAFKEIAAAPPSAINWTPILLVLGAIAVLIIGVGGAVFFIIRHRQQQEAYDAYIKHRYFEGDKTAEPPA
jgi:hypothetical protein